MAERCIMHDTIIPEPKQLAPDELDAWAQRVNFPVKELRVRLTNWRARRTGPKFVKHGDRPNATPYYAPEDLWAYQLSGGREARHDWNAKP